MDISKLSGVIDRSHVLRERLVRTAYALHLSAADAAALYERRGWAARQPSPVDHKTEAKKWRALSEQALDVAVSWGPPTTHPAVGDLPGSVPAAAPAALDGAAAEAADTMARNLAQTGLRLHMVLPLLTGEARQQVTDAVHYLDAAVRSARAVAVAMTGQSDQP